MGRTTGSDGGWWLAVATDNRNNPERIKFFGLIFPLIHSFTLNWHTWAHYIIRHRHTAAKASHQTRKKFNIVIFTRLPSLQPLPSSPPPPPAALSHSVTAAWWLRHCGDAALAAIRWMSHTPSPDTVQSNSESSQQRPSCPPAWARWTNQTYPAKKTSCCCWLIFLEDRAFSPVNQKGTFTHIFPQLRLSVCPSHWFSLDGHSAEGVFFRQNQAKWGEKKNFTSLFFLFSHPKLCVKVCSIIDSGVTKPCRPRRGGGRVKVTVWEGGGGGAPGCAAAAACSRRSRNRKVAFKESPKGESWIMEALARHPY